MKIKNFFVFIENALIILSKMSRDTCQVPVFANLT